MVKGFLFMVRETLRDDLYTLYNCEHSWNFFSSNDSDFTLFVSFPFLDKVLDFYLFFVFIGFIFFWSNFIHLGLK